MYQQADGEACGTHHHTWPAEPDGQAGEKGQEPSKREGGHPCGLQPMGQVTPVTPPGPASDPQADHREARHVEEREQEHPFSSRPRGDGHPQ